MSETTPLCIKHEEYQFISYSSNDMQRPTVDAPSQNDNTCLQHVLIWMSKNYTRLKNKRMYFIKVLLRTILFVMYFVLSSMIGKIVTMVFVVPRVNVNSPPAPDVLLEIIPQAKPIAFKVTEIITGVMSGLLVLITILNSMERFSIPHRFLFISGTLLNLRTLCISVTTFSIPSKELSKSCINLQQLQQSVLFQKSVNFLEFSETCGDYVFSGHATALIVTTWFVWYYSNCFEWHVAFRRMFNFTLLSLTFCGCFCIIIAKEHYAVDVILGGVIGILFCVLYHSQLDLFRIDQKSILRLPTSNTTCRNKYCLNMFVVWFYRLVETDSLETRIDEHNVEDKV